LSHPRVQRYATLLRFLLAGGLNTLFGWVIYALSVHFGAPPWLALIISTLTGIAFNFFSLGGYAFRDLAMQRLPRYLTAYGLLYAGNVACLSMLQHWVPNPIWAQLILTPVMAGCSFLMMSRWVFIGAPTAPAQNA
jgi:putative flippase GtrA